LQNQDLQHKLNGCMADFETAKKQAEELAAVLQEDLDSNERSCRSSG
jgi:hypothetical protein